MMKEEMENNNVIMYHFSEKKQKENTEEIGMASSLHTKSMTILPEDIQIALQYTSWKSCKRNNNSSIHGAELKQENDTSQPLCHTC